MKAYTKTPGALALLLASLAGISMTAEAQLAKPAVKLTAAQSLEKLRSMKYEGLGFPDFGFMVTPAEYRSTYSDQPIFKLKTDFPKKLPSKKPDFLDIDFQKEPLKYIEAVRAYAFEGNVIGNSDPNVPNDGTSGDNWNPFLNKSAQWYHIPWLHMTPPSGFPPNGGTEGFRGFIKEAPISRYQLGPDQLSDDYSVYAITLVNDFAGYSMGKMWGDPQMPDVTVLDKRFGDGFPIGTVFAKLLFTDAPETSKGDKVDYLETNPLTWKGYITKDWNSPTRIVKDLHLLQMDISVRDARADQPGLSGWVFGTFVYNGKVGNPNRFMNLVPSGLMWGNDPQVNAPNQVINAPNLYEPFKKPVTKTTVNPDLKQSVIFADQKHLPPQHLGYGNRLNGPADLTTSSCMSCHNAAQFPQIAPLVAIQTGIKPSDPKWMDFFKNIPCGKASDPNGYSTDFSFQVAMALTNFFQAKSEALQGQWSGEYIASELPIHRAGPDDVKKAAQAHEK